MAKKRHETREKCRCEDNFCRGDCIGLMRSSANY
jgi:hypothetical protein